MAGSQTITAVVAADAKPFKKGMQSAGKSTSVLSKSLKNVAVVGVAALAAVGAAAVAFGMEAIKAADKSRQISRSLETAVKNSKKFGSTSTQIKSVTKALDDASKSMAELVGIDDEVISGIKRTWISVPRIAKLGVNRLNALALTAADVAAGTGKSFENVAQAFTKAYADPKGALKKLQRSGIVLEEQEQRRYNLLVAQGKETEALAFLQDTLARKYKGQAEAVASPFARLQITWGNFMEDVGATFLPIIDENLPKLQKSLKDLSIDSNFQAALADLGDMIAENLPKAVDWLVREMPRLTEIMKGFTDVVTRLLDIVFPTKEQTAGYSKGFTGTGLVGKMDKLNVGQGAYMTYNVNINASSVDTSANTGKAIANALNNYVRQGGKVYSSGGARLY
jgi:hypothetical protein